MKLNADVMSHEPVFVGQTLLVIGGSSGIGLEIARRAHAEGAKAIITARDPERVHVAGVELDGSIAAFDATDFGRLGSFLDQLSTPVDHVVVSGPGPRHALLRDLDVQESRRELDAHLLLPLQVAGRARDKIRPGGTLLFLGCTPRAPTADGRTLGSTLTAALSALTRSLAYELDPVRVNMIAAGLVDARPRSIIGDRLDASGSRREIQHVLCIGDIAALALHVMTNMAMTGSTLDIDGGQRLVDG